jgi:hypothetical protein
MGSSVSPCPRQQLVAAVRYPGPCAHLACHITGCPAFLSFVPPSPRTLGILAEAAGEVVNVLFPDADAANADGPAPAAAASPRRPATLGVTGCYL